MCPSPFSVASQLPRSAVCYIAGRWSDTPNLCAAFFDQELLTEGNAANWSIDTNHQAGLQPVIFGIVWQTAIAFAYNQLWPDEYATHIRLLPGPNQPTTISGDPVYCDRQVTLLGPTTPE